MDFMCSSYERAAENREMVRLKQNIEWWVWMEALVKSWPRSKPLPAGIPLGNLPVIGKHEEVYGFHEIKE